MPFIHQLVGVLDRPEAAAEFRVNIIVGNAEAQAGGCLPDNLRLDHVLQVFEGHGAQVNPSSLVAVDALQHTDAVHQVAHGKADVPHLAGQFPGRAEEFQVIADAYDAHDHQDQGHADAKGYLLTASVPGAAFGLSFDVLRRGAATASPPVAGSLGYRFFGRPGKHHP